MITGVVNGKLEPTVQLVIHNATGQANNIEVVVDTAYDGFLSLQRAQVTALGLPLGNQQQVRLADGSIRTIDVYEATIIWDGQSRTVDVDAIDARPLVGTALLQGYELRVLFMVGGLVTIEAPP